MSLWSDQFTRNLLETSGVIVAPIDWDSLPVEIRAERQIVDLPSDATRWTRLRIGLQAAGVDATDFALPPGHSPYPGLRALTEDEAALFFGRATEVSAALDELHLSDRLPGARGEMRAAAGADLKVCRHFMDELARAAAAAALIEGGARPTIPIDQGEEFFNREGRAESEHFLAVLGGLLATPGGPIAAIAIRTDVYPLLQAERRIGDGLHQPFNLAPMPPDRFRAVIEGPAARAGVLLEPALTDALVRDASGADVLPLLAFTIERLHREFGAAGRLRLADYEAMGGVRSAIGAAFKAAFRAASTRAGDRLGLADRASSRHLGAGSCLHRRKRAVCRLRVTGR